jgi:hypothetical protein
LSASVSVGSASECSKYQQDGSRAPCVCRSACREGAGDTHQKVEEMHAILLQAKGARWVIVGMAGVAGLASGLIATLLP